MSQTSERIAHEKWVRKLDDNYVIIILTMAKSGHIKRLPKLGETFKRLQLI